MRLLGVSAVSVWRELLEETGWWAPWWRQMRCRSGAAGRTSGGRLLWVAAWTLRRRHPLIGQPHCRSDIISIVLECMIAGLTESLNTSTFGVLGAILPLAALWGRVSPFQGPASTVFSFLLPSLVPRSAHSPGTASSPVPAASENISIFAPFALFDSLFDGASCVAPDTDVALPSTDRADVGAGAREGSSSGIESVADIMSRSRKA
jgi:hypothetical protein